MANKDILHFSQKLKYIMPLSESVLKNSTLNQKKKARGF